MPTDAELVARALAGDGDAFDDLYVRYRDSLARMAYLLIGDAHLAQDLAQEAFVIAWQKLDRLRTPDVFLPWIHGILRNLCRRNWRRNLRFQALLHRYKLANLQGEIASYGAEPSDLELTVRQAISDLPGSMKEAVILRFYCGFSEEQIALALRCPIGTVKSRLYRARDRLASTLAPEFQKEGGHGRAL